MGSRRGSDFERKVRDLFASHGYEVVRSTVSKSAMDLVAIRKADGAYLMDAEVGEWLHVKPVIVQAKIGGRTRLGPGEWNHLYNLSLTGGAWAVLASQGKDGRRHVVALDLINGPRIPNSRHWPLRRLVFDGGPDAP